MVFWSLLNWIFSVFFLFLKVPHPTAVESIVKEWCTEGLPSLNDPGFVEVGVEAGFFKRFGGGFGRGAENTSNLKFPTARINNTKRVSPPEKNNVEIT